MSRWSALGAEVASRLETGDTGKPTRIAPIAGVGVSHSEAISLQKMSNIVALAKERPLVYLPSNDSESEQRLVQQSVMEYNPENFSAAAGPS
jgi:hypothetical protein